MEAIRHRRLRKQQGMLEMIDGAITKHYGYPEAHAGGPCSPAKRGPTMLDIAWMPESQGLFVDEYFSVQMVNFLISQRVVIWEERLKDMLRKRVAVLCPDIPKDVEPLELAVAVFGCVKCESPEEENTPLVLRYPEILAHECFRQDNRWCTSDEWPLPIDTEYQRFILDLERSTPCPRCPLVVERISMAGAQRACAALLRFNCNPSVITYAEMQAWDRREGLLIPPSSVTDTSLPEDSCAYFVMMLQQTFPSDEITPNSLI